MLIPAFAVERTQELLADILTLMDDGDVPEALVFLDSPLAIKACEVFRKHGNSRSGRSNPFEDVKASERLKFLGTAKESAGIERLRGWHIIMAGSGMCDAGRIRGHLKRTLWREETTVLLAGFQAVGTLGRFLQDGAPRVSIEGEEITVKSRIRILDVYSGHADADALVAWAAARRPITGSIFLNHGEPDAHACLRARLLASGFADRAIVIPALDTRFTLGAFGAPVAPSSVPRLPPAAAASLDWHNERARFLLGLDAMLDKAPTDAARRDLLARLSQDLAQ